MASSLHKTRDPLPCEKKTRSHTHRTTHNITSLINNCPLRTPVHLIQASLAVPRACLRFRLFIRHIYRRQAAHAYMQRLRQSRNKYTGARTFKTTTKHRHTCISFMRVHCICFIRNEYNMYVCIVYLCMVLLQHNDRVQCCVSNHLRAGASKAGRTRRHALTYACIRMQHAWRGWDMQAGS